MNNLIKMPLWLFGLITTTKSFKDNPIIGSVVLNRMGLHVIRVVLSHIIMRARMWMLVLPISPEDRKAYFKDGYILKENFLSDEDFNALEKEARAFNGGTREAIQGDTLTHRAELSPAAIENYPSIQKLIFNPQLGVLTRFTAGHFRMPLYYLEKIKNKYSKGDTDPQKAFHIDTFHPSMKCWFFIDDVSEEMGPYTYIPCSHKLTWKRLKWHYRMSLDAKFAENIMHAQGSFRFSDEELEKLGLPEPQSFTVKKNTLVIANVFGIHRRGDSQQKSTRLSIWGDSRVNPFLPFPGIGGQLANRIQYYFLGLFRKSADEKAAKLGIRSPWRVIEPEEK